MGPARDWRMIALPNRRQAGARKGENIECNGQKKRKQEGRVQTEARRRHGRGVVVYSDGCIIKAVTERAERERAIAGGMICSHNTQWITHCNTQKKVDRSQISV